MKKNIAILSLGILFLFAGAGQLSAQKCKYDFEKKDPITNEMTKGNTFGIKMWWRLGLNKFGDRYFVGMAITIAGNVRDIITPENTISFKLSNGEIIVLNAKEEYLPIAQATVNGVITVYQAQYDISKEDLQKLAASPLSYVKVNVGSARSWDSEFKEKKGAEFQQKANCIMQ
jgi:hypothetical protein